ncbi:MULTISPECIES: PfkB family carbohydrate kinase [Proteus]|uniref:PfkB family carbohydrate kinase n=1 Tax=Proteus appendicitidis TaxID=3034648 RepID=A0ABY8YCL0_9GAMM|nr:MULTISPECIES: PfkB family carbohydrate kinase [Proteus]MBG6026061.1 DeoR family transcriptional regulator [Proteus mirabilis]MBG6046847.1 DeoR family transcriptional regulator [Proteus mirabilis]QEZ92259.1 ribokinase [Proteus sp. CD3]WIV90198.1 PfkB family carbohydrate kinase [Proteus sp. HZ0627]
MFSEERRQEIYTIIREQKKVKVALLAEKFSVTLETIRSDLKYLEGEGLIKRCHGGAILGKQEIKKISKFSDSFDISCLLHDLLIVRERKDRTPEGKVCVLGSFVVDIIANVDSFPKVGELINSKSNSIGPGGKGTNQAIAASFSDAKVHLITKVGEDHFSKYAYKYLQESGIDSFTIFQTDIEPTGSSISYLADKTQNNITATYLGANNTFSDQEIDISLPYVSEADVLLLQGEINIEANIKTALFAKSVNKTVVLNVAPYNENLKQLYSNLDFITLNANQASHWAGIEINDINDAKHAIGVISGDENKKVIIYMDELGVVYFDGRATFHIPPMPSLRVDTMAATDAFNGAFASKIAAGGTMHESVLFASAFLSAFIEQKGVTAMPVLSQVQARLKSRLEDIRPQIICNEKRCI